MIFAKRDGWRKADATDATASGDMDNPRHHFENK